MYNQEKCLSDLGFALTLQMLIFSSMLLKAISTALILDM